MRYAIISDIHSNIDALRFVVDALKKEKVDQILCAGDIVGYGANPNECLALLEELGVIAVAGNHDLAVGGKLNYHYFAGYAQKAVDWTRQHLQINYQRYLNDLPLVYQESLITMVHGTLNSPEEFHYLNDIEKSLDTFFMMKTPVCFIGHTHVPQILIKGNDERVVYSDSLDVTLKPHVKYIVNVGSVGQPRDGNPNASYAIFDDANMNVSIKRVAYDIKAAQAKILEAGLPEMLAHRLAAGQ